MSIEVFHGSIEVIERPLCDVGRDNLDFGKGFYITDIREQAEGWARRQAALHNASPVLNIYSFDKEEYMKDGRSNVFTAYDEDWLDFIVANRNGENLAGDYDLIEGGVANDRIIDTIRLYMLGLMDIATALARLSQHQPNNQICLRNQKLIDKYLTFNGAENL